ncbi:MAG: hypothetical protein JWQ57_4351 [Mucilaginibacter sp.]|nr:hypothetical protein [Mucilaginibacter sp.]
MLITILSRVNYYFSLTLIFYKMIKPLSLSFIAFLLLANTHTNAQLTVHKFKITEISYGIYTSKTILKEAMAESPTGNHNYTDTSILVKKTQKIPAKSGIEFGAEYRLSGEQNDTARIEIEWIFPSEMQDPAKGTKYKSIKYPLFIPANMVNNSSYTLENDYEIIKGNWVLNIYYDDKILYSKKFELY